MRTVLLCWCILAVIASATKLVSLYDKKKVEKDKTDSAELEERCRQSVHELNMLQEGISDGRTLRASSALSVIRIFMLFVSALEILSKYDRKESKKNQQHRISYIRHTFAALSK